jgi:hypothetical protein
VLHADRIAAAERLDLGQLIEEQGQKIEARRALIGESIAVDVRERIEPAPPQEPVARVSTHRRYLEGDTLDPRCTGYIDEVGYLAHDGPVCPIHESGDVDPGDETDTPEEDISPERAEQWRAYHFDGGPSPLDEPAGRDELRDGLDSYASNARTALDDPGANEDAWQAMYDATRDPVHNTPNGLQRRYALDQLDQLICTLNPAELTIENTSAAFSILGRHIADLLGRLEAEGALEPGRSLVSDHVHAALDDLDHAIEALTPEED